MQDTMERTKPKENFTRDLRILPSDSYIADLIKYDAEKIADEIKDGLVTQVEMNRGTASFTRHVPDSHINNVVSALEQWAASFNYDFIYHDDTFSVNARCTNVSKKRCPTCHQYSKKLRRFFSKFVFSTVMITIFVSLCYITSYNSNAGNDWWMVLSALGSVILAIFSILWMGFCHYDLDKHNA